jgi:hypothetical protein
MNTNTDTKYDTALDGVFELPENCHDLFDWFLAPEIRAARRDIHRQIEQSQMTAPHQAMAKAVTTIHAITAQGRLNRQEKRAVNHKR